MPRGRPPPSAEALANLSEILRPLIFEHQLTQKEILQVLRQDHQIEFSERTLASRLKTLGLSTALPGPLSKKEKEKAVRLMKMYHTKRLTQAETINLIKMRHKLCRFSATQFRKLQAAYGLKWRLDDVELGVISFDDLAKMVLVRKDRMGDANAGLRRLTNIMSANLNLRVHRDTMNLLLHAIDPDGIQL